MSVRILVGDCRERMRELPDASVDSVVCDPPYHLTTGKKGGTGAASVNLDNPYGRARIGTGNGAGGFMGMKWDGGDVAFDPETWAEVLRVLKPGGHLIAFSGTRTYHRMAVAIEDAGFQVRDQLAWVYGSGFPKSHDVSKAIDKAAGVEREVVGARVRLGDAKAYEDCGQPTVGAVGHAGNASVTAPATDAAKQWQGWGTALKPAWEPICLARKPLDGSVASNVLTHGTGALHIDACRVDGVPRTTHADGNRIGNRDGATSYAIGGEGATYEGAAGRWPANLCHDGSEEVLAGFPDARSAGDYPSESASRNGIFPHMAKQGQLYSDAGSAARFFYCAKTTTEERGEGNNHPTVKPVALMRWLCRLITPKGGTVLDPFLGSGSTGLAADAEQFDFIGCELSPEYAAIAERRIRAAAGMFSDVKVAA